MKTSTKTTVAENFTSRRLGIAASQCSYRWPIAFLKTIALIMAQLIVVLRVATAAEPANILWTRTRLDLFGDDIGVAVSPSGAFFASDGFAIDRSLDQGQTWSEVTGFASFAGGAIAIDPSNPNVMIAGRSHGLLKSVDGGSNWFSLVDLNAGRAANAIAFAPQNTLTIYAGVGDGWGLYKSTNGGATWSNPLTSRAVYDVAINPFDPQVLYLATHAYYSQPGGLLKSTDGGLSWITVFQNPMVDTVTIDSTDPNLLFATTEDGGIYKSLDGGLAWRETSGDGIFAPVRALIAHPGNSSLLYAATAGQGVFYSSDQGETWSVANAGLTDLNVVAMSIQEQSPNTMLVATYGGQGFRGSVVPEPMTTAFLLVGTGLILCRRARPAGQPVRQDIKKPAPASNRTPATTAGIRPRVGRRCNMGPSLADRQARNARRLVRQRIESGVPKTRPWAQRRSLLILYVAINAAAIAGEPIATRALVTPEIPAVRSNDEVKITLVAADLGHHFEEGLVSIEEGNAAGSSFVCNWVMAEAASLRTPAFLRG